MHLQVRVAMLRDVLVAAQLQSPTRLLCRTCGRLPIQIQSSRPSQKQSCKSPGSLIQTLVLHVSSNGVVKKSFDSAAPFAPPAGISARTRIRDRAAPSTLHDSLTPKTNERHSVAPFGLNSLDLCRGFELHS